MSETNNIPEAVEADAFARRYREAMVLGRSVHLGSNVGFMYAALLTLPIMGRLVDRNFAMLLPHVADLLIVACLAWCVRRWSQLAAWLLFAYPISIKLFLAVTSHPKAGIGVFEGIFLVFFLLYVGKAAMAIRRFSKLTDGEASQEA